MAYDEQLAERLRVRLEGEPGVTERRMFGSAAFLVNGNLAVCASGQGGLMLRCDPDGTAALLGEPSAHPMVMRGREMTGWLRVLPEAVAAEEDLRRWVDVGVGYARSLPPK